MQPLRQQMSLWQQGCAEDYGNAQTNQTQPHSWSEAGWCSVYHGIHQFSPVLLGCHWFYQPTKFCQRKQLFLVPDHLLTHYEYYEQDCGHATIMQEISRKIECNTDLLHSLGISALVFLKKQIVILLFTGGQWYGWDRAGGVYACHSGLVVFHLNYLPIMAGKFC